MRRSWRKTGLYDDHVGSAARACQSRPGSELGDQAPRIEAEEPLQQRDGALAVGMQEAEVAGTAKALRQDMLEHQGEKTGPGQGAVRDTLALGIAVAEGHLPVLAGDDARWTWGWKSRRREWVWSTAIAPASPKPSEKGVARPRN